MGGLVEKLHPLIEKSIIFEKPHYLMMPICSQSKRMTMKTRIFSLAIALLTTLSLFGQRQETLFDNTETFFSGIWGGTTLNYSVFDNDWALSRGGYIGLEFGRSFVLGYSHLDLKEDIAIGPDNARFDLKLNGFLFAIKPYSRRVIHPRISIVSGRGRIRMEDGDRDRVFVFQPSAGIEMNVFTWFHVGLDGGYRFISDAEVGGLSNSDFSTPFAQVEFRFGISW